ncbi:MAG: hypothetical protein H6622_07385 [Halobacteriovoraceae bacterium]|nr:hypothetical protein [Halobacteriovoraceae bacterium]
MISVIYAQDEIIEAENAPLQLKQSILELNSIDPKNYTNVVEEARTKITKYIEFKKRVCNGEFSVAVTNSPDLLAQGRRKLNRAERKVCFKELEKFQVDFIESMYNARKSFLEFLHRERLEKLEESKAIALKKLGISFENKK